MLVLALEACEKEKIIIYHIDNVAFVKLNCIHLKKLVYINTF
jgi:hypothetical protein